MAKVFFIASTLFLNHEVLSQILRPSLGLIRTQDPIIVTHPYQLEQRQSMPKTSRYITDADQYVIPITDVPISSLFNTPNSQNIPSASINIPSSLINTANSLLGIPNYPQNTPKVLSKPIVPVLSSECTPKLCDNLKNTIKLWTIADYLENQNGGADVAFKMAARIVSKLLAKTSVARRFVVVPRVAAPSTISSNVADSVLPLNIMSSTSDTKIERGQLIKLLKLLGDGM